MNSLVDFDFPCCGTGTQKLSSLIGVAKNMQELLPGAPLVYRISGDVIEIHVQSNGTFDEDYRLGIINSGLVISRLRRVIEDVGYVPLVQSFPNMLEPNLIAFVRIAKQDPVHDFADSKHAVMEPVSNPEGEACLLILKYMLIDKNVMIYEYTRPAQVNRILNAGRNGRDNSDQTIVPEYWSLSLPFSRPDAIGRQSMNRLWLVSTQFDNAISWLSAGKTLGSLMVFCHEGSWPYQFDIDLVKETTRRNDISRQFTAAGHTQLLLSPGLIKTTGH
ncbi:MAG: hypothetical protein WD266_09555 [Balneolales bacterium]